MISVTSWDVIQTPPPDGYGLTKGTLNEVPPPGWVRLFDQYWYMSGESQDYITHLPRMAHDKIFIHPAYGSGAYTTDIESAISEINAEFYGS
jgi:hypothetical protein